MSLAIFWGAIIAVLIGFFFWLPFHLHRHPEHRSPNGGHASGFLGIADEIFHPDAQAARIVIDEQQRRVDPAPTPDGDKGIHESGRIRIVLPDAMHDDAHDDAPGRS